MVNKFQELRQAMMPAQVGPQDQEVVADVTLHANGKLAERGQDTAAMIEAIRGAVGDDLLPRDVGRYLIEGLILPPSLRKPISSIEDQAGIPPELGSLPRIVRALSTYQQIQEQQSTSPLRKSSQKRRGLLSLRPEGFDDPEGFDIK